MEGEISELRELILALQDGQREEKGRREQVEKEVEELKEMILIMRAEGDKKDKEIMKLKKPNKSVQEEKEVLFKDEFDKEMKHFEKEMKIVKAGWEEKKKKMAKVNMKWKWADKYGDKYDGWYEGQVKGGVPHGLGKWKRDGRNWTVEGEWEDGLLNGRVVENYSDGDRK